MSARSILKTGLDSFGKPVPGYLLCSAGCGCYTLHRLENQPMCVWCQDSVPCPISKKTGARPEHSKAARQVRQDEPPQVPVTPSIPENVLDAPRPPTARYSLKVRLSQEDWKAIQRLRAKLGVRYSDLNLGVSYSDLIRLALRVLAGERPAIPEEQSPTGLTITPRTDELGNHPRTATKNGVVASAPRKSFASRCAPWIRKKLH